MVQLPAILGANSKRPTGRDERAHYTISQTHAQNQDQVSPLTRFCAFRHSAAGENQSDERIPEQVTHPSCSCRCKTETQGVFVFFTQTPLRCWWRPPLVSAAAEGSAEEDGRRGENTWMKVRPQVCFLSVQQEVCLCLCSWPIRWWSCSSRLGTKNVCCRSSIPGETHTPEPEPVCSPVSPELLVVTQKLLRVAGCQINAFT